MSFPTCMKETCCRASHICLSSSSICTSSDVVACGKAITERKRSYHFGCYRWHCLRPFFSTTARVEYETSANSVFWPGSAYEKPSLQTGAYTSQAPPNLTRSHGVRTYFQIHSDVQQSQHGVFSLPSSHPPIKAPTTRLTNQADLMNGWTMLYFAKSCRKGNLQEGDPLLLVRNKWGILKLRAGKPCTITLCSCIPL